MRQTATRLRYFYESVRFEHTLFALPFAYIGMFLAAQGWPTLSQFIWITVAMIGARTLAMSSNRLIHRREDTANPRTSDRHLPLGLISPLEMGILMLVSVLVFIFAAYQLNTLTFALAPVAVVFVVLYSFAKYYTWSAHFVLGWADAIAPVGGWIAVAGTVNPEPAVLAFAVAMWVGGFDILYACQDVSFDKSFGIHSIPRRFGVHGAFVWYRSMHASAAVALLALGIWMGLGVLYFIGWSLVSLLLIYQHRLVSPTDMDRMNKAFFTVNTYVSMTLLLFTGLEMIT